MSNNNDDRDRTHGNVSDDTKRLELAPPMEPICSPGVRIVDSLESPPVVFADNYDMAPGAFPVLSSRNTARLPISSYQYTREFTNEESKQEELVPNSAAVYSGANDRSGMAADSAVYAVEAQRVPDGNEEGTRMVAESKYVRLKWYLLGFAFFACGLVGAVVVLLVRPPSAAPTSSVSPPSPAPIEALDVSSAPSALNLTTAPSALNLTTAPVVAPTLSSSAPVATALTSAPVVAPTLSSSAPVASGNLALQVACDFINSEIAVCPTVQRVAAGATDRGVAIPSEIGLLTALTFMNLQNSNLIGGIPSTMASLVALTYLNITGNSVTGTIPDVLCAISLRAFVDCGEVSCSCCNSGDGVLC